MTENKVAKIAEPFVCGGTAATFASIAIHPMDLAKVCAFEPEIVLLLMF
jgi:solute carrier family 25 oxoglutarate transporter 11